MAITPQVAGQAIDQPVPAFIDTLSKTPSFGSKFNERKSSLDAAKYFENYLGRVHKKYKNMDTENIENLVNRLLQEKDPTLKNLVREETSLKDTFKNRFIEAKTPLGQVLQELQNSQESPNRKLLSKEILIQAEKEAGDLTKKKVALTTEKGKQKQVSNEIPSILKRQEVEVTKIGSEFLVNTRTTNWQSRPSVASLSTGQFIVTWDGAGQTGDPYGVQGQIFNADGTQSGSEFPVNTYTTSFQERASVASLSTGKFVVTWESNAQDGDGFGVYGQIFNADGTQSGSEFQVNTYTTGDQMEPSVTSLSNGQFVVTWQSDVQDGDSWGVYGQVFNADGTQSGSEFPVNTYTISNQDHPSVASLSNDRFVITWDSWDQDGDYYGVYGQIFNADGTKNGSEFQINTYTANSQKTSAVASLSNDTFVVTWASDNQDGDSWGVYGQVFNADGTKSGSEFQVNTEIISEQIKPSVVSLSNGQFIVTWGSYLQDGDGWGVYGQVFNADGTKSGSEFPVNTYTTGDQSSPSVASLNNDRFVITWDSWEGQDGDGYGVYGQIFETDIISSSSISSSSSSTRQSESTTAKVASGAERQTSHIALTALRGIAQTIKNAIGY